MAVRMDNSTPNRKINYKVTVGKYLQVLLLSLLSCSFCFIFLFWSVCYVLSKSPTTPPISWTGYLIWNRWLRNYNVKKTIRNSLNTDTPRRSLPGILLASTGSNVINMHIETVLNCYIFIRKKKKLNNMTAIMEHDKHDHHQR